MKCEICGKECKTQQGLAGHMRWLHGRPGRKQAQLFPTRRLITDVELIELFKERDASMARAHKAILDIAERTRVLLGEILRLDGEVAELRQAHSKVPPELRKTKV